MKSRLLEVITRLNQISGNQLKVPQIVELNHMYSISWKNDNNNCLLIDLYKDCDVCEIMILDDNGLRRVDSLDNFPKSFLREFYVECDSSANC